MSLVRKLFITSAIYFIVLTIGLFAYLHRANAQSTSTGSTTKVALTGHQLIGYNKEADAIPFALSTFIGEKITAFGDAGIFLEYVFPKNTASNGYMAGISVAPYIFNLNWGRLLWKNQIGYGRYGSTGGVNFSSGFQFEPGSFIHFRIEGLARFPTTENPQTLPAALALGIGFNM